MKIYTRTGDAGETSLLGGKRVRKDDLRVAAYGEVDELNAAVAVAEAAGLDARARALLQEIQRDLFAIGALLADPGRGVAAKREKTRIGAEAVARLEEEIDRREARLPRLRAFILPGGAPGAAQLHLARGVCRRAERAVIALARRERVAADVLAYLNRLSDLLFVMARDENRRRRRAERRW
ncbi:MAG TPA: cob(I)yrinic acid a,c-diamide adenosyltransferase [Vicinamibacteria bacterium]|nr:cob(I)yrinic acid a,c-diamide adenosyltransferase [Vicinamibacteria bacterium]